MSSGFKISILNMKNTESKGSNKISQTFHQFGGRIAKCHIRSLPLEAVASLTSPLITRIKDSKEMIVTRNIIIQRKMKEAPTALFLILIKNKIKESWTTAKLPISVVARGRIVNRVILMM